MATTRWSQRDQTLPLSAKGCGLRDYIGAYINKFIHCMLCLDVCCVAEIILQRPIGSALYWAWLVKVLSGLLPDCLSICPGSAYCPCCPLILGRLFLEPQKPRDNRNHDNRTHDNRPRDNRTLRQVRYCRSLSMNMH